MDSRFADIDSAAGASTGASPQQAQAMRAALHACLARLSAGQQDVLLPPPQPAGLTRGEGHFHLAPELFLQVAGWSRFRFAQGELELRPGELLLLPPRWQHAERVGPAADGRAFGNIVIYAEERALTCHLAHEVAPGVPDILHIEARQHPQARLICHWLGEAARLGTAPAPAWHAVQLRALCLAALAGVLGALDDDEGTRPEPVRVARVRQQIQNRLGDPQLSVRQLAEQSGCSADYLSHLFVQATGERLAACINRLRIERAAHLLGEGGLASKEVAWACGFVSQSYFIRQFRARFAMTPKAWRARNTAQDAAP